RHKLATSSNESTPQRGEPCRLPNRKSGVADNGRLMVEREGSNGLAGVKMPVDHEFGGQHTELKLSIIEKYLQAYSSALRNKFPELLYIDAFAGTGKRTVKVEARGEDLFDAEVPESVE